MTDERPSEVLGGLPRTRPHRRSQKRAGPPSGDAGQRTTTEPTPASTTPPAPAIAERAPDVTPITALPPEPRARRAPPAPRAATSAAAPGATKRATRSASRVRQPAQPPGTPPAPRSRRPTSTGGVDLVGSAVHVTAELAEIGISAGARVLRGVVARLPRP